MAVRFVMGRAGTGKTALCLREMRAEMARDPLRGGSLLLLVPEQGTFSAERQLLTEETPGTGPPPRGTFRAQVMGFRRLAMLIAAETGIAGEDGGRAKPMDDIARAVLLEEIVRREKHKLTVFRAAAERPGFGRTLDGTLRELRQHGHSGASLRQLVDGGMDATTSRKLLDLAVLLDAWSLEIARTNNWDFEQLMHAAALKAGGAPLIVGEAGRDEPAHIWVDAISAMSALEMRLLAELGQHARHMTITLLADPDAPAFRAGRASPEHVGDLFTRTERLHRHLLDEFRRHQVRLGPALPLREHFRFAHPDLARVEAELFEDHPPPPPAKNPRPTARKPGGVEVWQCGDPEAEVRAVAAAIRYRILEADADRPPLRCRQIGVIVPGLEGYEDALRRVFHEHGIPHFVDRRRTIAHHPLVELLRSALAIVTSRWDREAVTVYLKTGLAGLTPADVALLENYLIEHGISHIPWDKAWTWLAPNQRDGDEDVRVPESARPRLQRINFLREQVWNSIRAFVDRCAKEPSTDPGADGRVEGAACFAKALRDLLTTLGAQATIQQWIAAARAAGDQELAQIHEQAWREVDRTLQLLETLFAGRQWTLADFERVLESALEQLTLGLIPPTVDQVLISSVERSRIPEMEVVFILGAVEGQFPKVVDEDPILSDEQRAAFNARAADPIGQGSEGRLFDMVFLDYVALTRSRRELIVTYPVADRRGKALAPSRHLSRLQAMLGDALRTRSFDARSHTRVERMRTPTDLITGVAAWARRLVYGEGTPADVNAQADATLMSALYNQVATTPHGVLARARDMVWRALSPRGAVNLSPELAAQFYPPAAPLLLSVSQLEKFAACPLQYFLHYTLKLSPRAEFRIDQLGIGLLQHRILERVYGRILAGELRWPNDAAALAASLREEIDLAASEIHAELAQQTAGYEAIRTRLNRALGILLEADRRRSQQGSLRPAAVELIFGGSGLPRYQGGRLVSLPVLPIKMDATRFVHVNGKIDRLDMAEGGGEAAVIDYKSASNMSMELARVLYGLSLQLPAYALVVRDLANLSPVAALYWNLGLYLKRIEHAADAKAKAPETDEFYQQFPPRGIIDARAAHHLDAALQPNDAGSAGTGKSAWYKMSFTREGIALRSDLLAPHDFATVLDYTRWKIAELGAALASGTIAPGPYRAKSETACDRCDFTALCTFDRVAGDYRPLQRATKAKLLHCMQELLAGGSRCGSRPPDPQAR